MYEKGIEGKWKESIVPGTNTKNYHKFLNIKY
jgi:hypothetical protein